MEVLHALDADFKAEAMGASLLLAGHHLSQIIIERMGSNPRTHSKDIASFFEDTGQYNLDQQTIIQSFRQGIYDALPENIFHPPTLGGIERTTSEIVDEIRLQRTREQQARKFFSPFEQEGAYIEMSVLALELSYEQKGTFDHLLSLFKQAWPVLQHLPQETTLCFIYLLPVLHEMRGNQQMTELCFSYILGYPVTITEMPGNESIGTHPDNFTIGSSRLGIDTKFSGDLYDGLSNWVMQFGPVPHEHTAEVLPHSDFHHLLALLSDYFIPSGRFIKHSVVFHKEQSTLLDKDENSSRLGHTFFL